MSRLTRLLTGLALVAIGVVLGVFVCGVWVADAITLPLAMALSTLIIAVAAVFAAWSAVKSSRVARDALMADLAYRLLDEYGRPQMFKSLSELGAWKKELHLADLGAAADAWLVRRNAGQERALEIDDARRAVKLFYHKAVIVDRQGALDSDFRDDLAASSAKNILFPIVELLEERLARELGTLDSHKRVFARMRSVFT